MRIELPGSVPAEPDEGELYFVGNATTVIRYGGFTILTDPAFLHAGEHIHLGHGMYARRDVEPACQVADLPPLDAVVLSHYHGDHFDDVAAAQLDKRLPIITTSHAVERLTGRGFGQGYALQTWDSLEIVKGPQGDAVLRVTAMPAKHAPDHVAGLLPPVIGSMLDFHVAGEHRFRLYITGDTLLHERLYDIPRAYPGIDLALVHAGGTTLLGTVVTMTGEQAVRAVEITEPRTAIPIHFDDFSVFASGLDEFQDAAAKSSALTAFGYLSQGETYRFAAGE
jgi:L-ascorbate metabolism protein UlaG (beta-lactamase superfamily)